MSEETYDLEDLVERCENRISLLRNKILESGRSLQAVQAAALNNKLSLEAQAKQVKESLCRIIDSNYENLCNAVSDAAAKDLQNIRNNEECLTNDLEKGNGLIASAKNLSNLNPESLNCINQWLSDVNKGPPELPIVSLSLSTKINESHLVAVEEKAMDLLKVNMTGAVQIVECLERPGAIIVSWDEQQASDSESVTTDDNSNITEYILQVCKDDEGVFRTLFEGEDMTHTMKFADPNVIYSFRVCKYHNSPSRGAVCGPWSMVKKACTSLLPHAWRENDCATESGLQLYQISNKGRTATKVFPESSRILRSQGPSYRIGQTLTFLIEETGESSANDGIGFISYEQQTDTQLTQSKHAAIMNTRGTIFVNGSSMVTKLPAIKRNSVAVFQASLHNSGKLRVSISVDDKEVTFDWTTTTNPNEVLYFACGFEHTGWQLSVG